MAENYYNGSPDRLFGRLKRKFGFASRGVEGSQSTDDNLFNRDGPRSVFGFLPPSGPKRLDELGTAPPQACSHGFDLAAGVLDRRLERPAGVESKAASSGC